MPVVEVRKPSRRSRSRPLRAQTDAAGPAADGHRDWYILKVQSNREDSIREALQRKINMAGLQDFFGEAIVPIEMVSEFKNGKKRIVKRKLYPGYLVVNMELNEDTWFLVRETHGLVISPARAANPARCCRMKWPASSASRKRRPTKPRS